MPVETRAHCQRRTARRKWVLHNRSVNTNGIKKNLVGFDMKIEIPHTLCLNKPNYLVHYNYVRCRIPFIHRAPVCKQKSFKQSVSDCTQCVYKIYTLEMLVRYTIFVQRNATASWNNIIYLYEFILNSIYKHFNRTHISYFAFGWITMWRVDVIVSIKFVKVWLKHALHNELLRAPKS